MQYTGKFLEYPLSDAPPSQYVYIGDGLFLDLNRVISPAGDAFLHHCISQPALAGKLSPDTQS